jgi:hypothetical protein
MGYPTIGSTNFDGVVVAFQAFMTDTSTRGYNYSDIFATRVRGYLNDWTIPINLTYSATLDERYPSLSKYYPSVIGGVLAPIAWQEDTEPGSFVLGDDVPVTRTKQVFARATLVDVEERQSNPRQFFLAQNYPNPFNPNTIINYELSIDNLQLVTLKVFDVLGREVATLVNEVKEAGMHEVRFDATNLSSGVYFYTLLSGSFIETKMMILLR